MYINTTKRFPNTPSELEKSSLIITSFAKDVEHHHFSYFLVNRYNYFRKHEALSCSFDIFITYNQALKALNIY